MTDPKCLKIILRLALLAALALLPAVAFGQRPVEPTRVAIGSEADTDDSRDFHRAFRSELKKLRDVAVVSGPAHLDVYLAATSLTERGRFVGYAASALVELESGGRKRKRLQIATGPTLENLARHLVEWMDREFFDRRRQG